MTQGPFEALPSEDPARGARRPRGPAPGSDGDPRTLGGLPRDERAEALEAQLAEQGVSVLVRAAAARQLRDPLLVLEAVGLSAEIVGAGQQVLLTVPSAEAPGARGELLTYLSENKNFRQEGEPFVARAGAGVTTVWYAIVLSAVFAAQNMAQFGERVRTDGRLDAELVRDGEWWRAITALTLHVDAAHLGGNLVFGALFGYLLAQVVGGGVGWLAILLAGILGDLANAWVRQGAHLSIGASTAVFGAVGLLVAVESMRRGREEGGWFRLLTPPVLGLVLLGWLGMGEGRVDVVAHVGGFVAGLALAPFIALGERFGDLERPALQIGAGLLALAVVSAGWVLALV